MMKHSSLFLMLIVFLSASCSLLGNGGSDGLPGNIIFSAEQSGHHQIFSMREDGSGVRQLTDGDLSSTYPAWSPDGRRIAYARETPQFSAYTLWVMDADGSNKQPLVTNPRTGSPQLGTRPAWSPDGTKLAFDKCLNCEIGGSNYEIFVADLQTGAIDTLTDHLVDDTHPTWSPDGQQIAFESNRDYFDADSLRFRNDLYIVNAGGSNLQRLTETGISRNPVWNPGKNIIGYGSNVPSSLGLFQINVLTGEITGIKEDFSKKDLLVPLAWSSDGQRLLIFSSLTSNTGLKNFTLNIVDTESGQSTSLTSDYLDDLGFSKDIGSDQDVEAYVHDTEEPNNAHYDRPSEAIRFGDIREFAKQDEVIYHEFTHAMTDAENGSHYINPGSDEEGAQ